MMSQHPEPSGLSAGASSAEVFSLLRLTLTRGLGPVLIGRLLAKTGSAEAAANLSPAQLRLIEGIGPAKAATIGASLAESGAAAEAELRAATRLGVRLITRSCPEYPPLLAQTPAAPPLLYVRGSLRHADQDRFTVAIVGSRECTQYGLEQARRFAGTLATAGLTVVSGGARGIDSAAHWGAVNAGGRTIAVLGCGLEHIYPPENRELFDRIAAQGAVVSELPLRTAPAAENFPARNRIVSGLSLGVLVIEAGLKSGALITAALATEEHGREVLALPGRVDSPASRGTLDLLRSGSAAMALDPSDVIHALESAARHLAGGTHAARFVQATQPNERDPEPVAETAPAATAGPTSGPQGAVLASLDEPRTIDQVVATTGLAASEVRSALTLLEIQGRVTRAGSRFRRS